MMNTGMQGSGSEFSRSSARCPQAHSARHCERVAEYALAIADELGLAEDEKRHLRCAAMLHDLGKVRLSERTHRSLGRLTEEDLMVMRRHSAMTIGLLEGIDELRKAVPSIRLHNERYDGQGPEGLRGSEIPLCARILSVAEAYDLQISDIPWRDALTHEQAMDELRLCSGTQFDPDIVAAFERCITRSLPKAA